ncbi:MAG: ABC transporter permease [Bernardetiaceae bacterium]|nr:ABC transporter permease [Bernardetiaceae bacterium]
MSNLLNVLILALGTAVIILLMLVSHQFEDKLLKNTKGIDLVVGAKGSPMQLILSSIFHIDNPTGNIKLGEAQTLARNRMVKSVVPLALGDSYQWFKIVGTTRRYPEQYGAELAQGRWWATGLEATIGARVATEGGLQLGSPFVGAHGGDAENVHGDHVYQVVGIMKPTGTALDNLVLTNVQAVWAVHETHSEADSAHAPVPAPGLDTLTGLPQGDSTKDLTTLLIKYRSPMAAINLPRFVNSQTNMQAASPAFEVRRLFDLLGIGLGVMQGFAYLMVVISMLSIFLALYNALKERRYDLAMMRSLGSSRARLFALVVLEGLLLTLVGGLLGLLLGHLATGLLGHYNEQAGQTGLTGWLFLPLELAWLGLCLGVGLVAALIPAYLAYRTDIANVLAQGR